MKTSRRCASDDVTAARLRRRVSVDVRAARLRRRASVDVTAARLRRRPSVDVTAARLRRREGGPSPAPSQRRTFGDFTRSSKDQNSKVSSTDSRWEQGRYLPRLCRRMSFLALEMSCTPQLVLPFLNDSRFLLPSLRFPSLSITCSALIRIWKWNDRVADLCKHMEELSERKYEMQFCHVGQPGFQFLISGDSPALASQVPGLQGHELTHSITEDLQLDKPASAVKEE
ncbi:uncharacterized protein LOC103788015 isoform X2 [Callithrix jacchus]